MEKIRPVRGFKDLLPEEYAKHKHIIDTGYKISTKYGFLPIDLPILEYSEVFCAALGEGSDVISKETYTFVDKSEDKVTLRPEFTAGVQRCVLSNNLIDKLPLRFFLHGPLFRRERPQKGRYRQFNQINFEHIGSNSALHDAQLIKMCFDILSALSLENKVRLEINSLGCHTTLKNYQNVLLQYFSKNQNSLSEDSKLRLQNNNVLRILDSKQKQDILLSENAPSIEQFYTEDAATHFNLVQSYLNAYGVKYTINTKLVRGLDYYKNTVFEFKTDLLGAQMTVFAGGRYTIKGSKEVSAIGAAAGVERLALLMDTNIKTEDKLIIIAPLDEIYCLHAIELFQQLLDHLTCNMIIESTGTLKKKMKTANSLNASYIILIGEDEVINNQFTIKNLTDGSQTTCSLQQVIGMINN
jgi:histidyl-tRNA synthetase